MGLKLATETDILALKKFLKDTFKGRDKKWADRRKVRYRRMGRELSRLPLNPEISDRALMVAQSEAPNQEAHKRTKRLVANRPRFEIILYDADPDDQALGQDLEDGLKALYNWMNRGKSPFDWKVVQFQQGDGVGVGKLDFLPGHGSSLADYEPDDLESEEPLGDEYEEPTTAQKAKKAYQKALEAAKTTEGEADPEKEAYHKATQDALRAELPPFRLSAVDPLTCYWWEDGDGIAVIMETGKRSLNPLLDSFKEYGLTIDNENNLVKVGKSDAIGGVTIPPDSATGRDLGQEVDYTEIRTRDEIVIYIEHPKMKDPNKKGDGKGIFFKFDNPFGPYTTGYALVPGDITTESDPADAYQPSILGTLNVAQPMNVLMTARLSAALAAALSPRYIKVSADTPMAPSDEDKTPTAEAGKEIPIIPGEIKMIESPTIDLDKADERLFAEYQDTRFQDVLMGDATSDASGHRLAIQTAQADLQMVPYQNARKLAIEELMKGIVYAIKKHGLPIYIPTLPETKKRGKQGIRVAKKAKITPEMADLSFELIITLGSETPVSKYAKWQALAQREEQGTAGYQTVVEESDTENPDEEIARVFEGKVLKATMEQTVPRVVERVMAEVEKKFQALLNPQAAMPPAEIPMGIDPATGLAMGGGGEVGAPDMVRLPGVGMSPAGPSTSDFGPTVAEGGGESTVPMGY